MKKKSLLSILLVLALMTALCTGAAATGIAKQSVSFALNKAYSATAVYTMPAGDGSEKIIGVSVISGSLPDGMSVGFSDYSLTMSGTPTKAGTFEFSLQATTNNGYMNVPVGATVSGGDPVVTKSPTGETVTEGEDALFIAKGDNVATYKWRFVNPSGSLTYFKEDINTVFPSLVVKGDTTTDLELENIPLEMDRWKVTCQFTGTNGTKIFSGGAVIHVNAKELAQASITGQPSGGSVVLGEQNDFSLSVRAQSPDGNTLKYQWYSTTQNSISTIRAIDGATLSSYLPVQDEGTLYYCVGVWNTKGTNQSTPVYSQLVAVTFTAPAPTPTPTPEATATPAPQGGGQSDPTPTAAPVVTPAPSGTKGGTGNTVLLVVLLIAGVLVLGCGLVLIFVSLKNRGGKGGSGGVPQDGGRKRVGRVIVRCSRCGWTPKDQTNIPKFCPDCGDPMDGGDVELPRR